MRPAHVGTNITSLATQGGPVDKSGQWPERATTVHSRYADMRGEDCFERLHSDSMQRSARHAIRQDLEMQNKRAHQQSPARPLPKSIYSASSLLGTHRQPAVRSLPSAAASHNSAQNVSEHTTRENSTTIASLRGAVLCHVLIVWNAKQLAHTGSYKLACIGGNAQRPESVSFLPASSLHRQLNPNKKIQVCSSRD